MLLKRPLDLVGTMPENRVVGERHPLTTEAEKVFTLELGSFYTNSVVIRDVGTGNILVKDVDYHLLGYNDKAAKECGGKQIDTIVAIVRSDVATAAVDYQAVGGIYSNLSMAFVDLLRQVKDTDRSKVDWMEDIINKPPTTDPTPHTHEIREISDIEDGVGALTKLLAAIYSLDDKDYRGIYDALYRKIANVRNELDNTLDFVETELDAVARKSEYQPGDVIVGDFSENPGAFYPEVDWVLLPETFLYGNTFNSSTDPLTVNVKPGTGLVARTTHIYIAVPKGGARYSLSRSASAINEGETVEITLTGTDAIPGMSVGYVITGVSSSDINTPLVGSLILDANLTARLEITAVADFVTEGDEILKISLVNDPRVTTSVTIKDTSLTPIFDTYYSSDLTGVNKITSMNEGQTAYYQIRSTNVPDDTVVNLYYSGTAVKADFSSAFPATAILSGSKFTMPVTSIADETTEGNEVLLIKLSLSTEENATVASSITVVDTSKTQIWDLYYSSDSAGSDRILSVSEGEEFNLIVLATNVANGTLITLNYGGSANVNDLELRYDVLTVMNGRATCKMKAREDFETEGSETLTITALLNARPVASGTLTILDTSASANTSLKFSSNSTGSNFITQANEGDTFYMVLNAIANLPDGTILDIRYEGTATDDDFTKPRARTATVLNKKATVEYTVKADGLNEGDEVMRVRIINTTNNLEVGTEQITIKDTSRSPTYNVFYSGGATSNTAITNINEGQTAYLTVTGENIPNGKVLNCEQYIGGLLAITTNGDVDVNPATTIVINDNRGSIPIRLKEDMRTEGAEPLLGIVKDGTVELGRKEIVVNDTSITPTYNMWFSSNENGDALVGNAQAGQDVWLVVQTTGLVTGTRMYLSYEGYPGNLTGAVGEITQGASNRTSIKLSTKVLWAAGWDVTVKLFTDTSKTINVGTSKLTVGSSVPTLYFSSNALGNNNLNTFNEDEVVYAHATFPNVANGITAPFDVVIANLPATAANGHVWEDVNLTPVVSNGRVYTTIKLKDDQAYTGDMPMYFGITGTNHRANATVIDKPVITTLFYTGSTDSFFGSDVYNGRSYNIRWGGDLWDYFVSVNGRAPNANEDVIFTIPDNAAVLSGYGDSSTIILSNKWNNVKSVTIVNNGLLLGIGGKGRADYEHINNNRGRMAIINNSTKTLNITNTNVIAGGGGGGGNGTYSTNVYFVGGGGGGAPFGIGAMESNVTHNGNAGYFTVGGLGGTNAGLSGRYSGGTGGAWGATGAPGRGTNYGLGGDAGAPFAGLVNVTNVGGGRVLGKGYTS